MRPPVLFSKAPPGRHISGPLEPKVPFRNIMPVMADMRNRTFQKAPPGRHVSRTKGACGAEGAVQGYPACDGKVPFWTFCTYWQT